MLYQVITKGQSWADAIQVEACSSADAAQGAVWDCAVERAANFDLSPLRVIVRPASACDGVEEVFQVSASISVTAEPCG